MFADRRPRPRHGGRGALAAGVCAGLLASFTPMTTVVMGGPWLLGVIVVLVAVPVAGLALRAARLPQPAVALGQVIVWLGLVAVMFSATVFPHGSPSWPVIPRMLRAAAHEVEIGVAPLIPSVPLSFALVAGFGAVAVVVDQLAVAARAPLAAGAGLVAVSLIPSLAVPGPLDVFAFVVVAAAVLWLMRTETRTRRRPAHGTSDPSHATGVMAAGVGVIAVVAALVVTPALPTPEAASAGAGTTTINASLDLGRDLRRPTQTDVLSLSTDAASAPYLRVATLSSFTGRVWHPDTGGLTPIDADGAFADPDPADGIEQEKVDTHVHIDALTSRYLPVPYPAVALDGLDGRWNVMAQNRTVVGEHVSTHGGLDYTVTTRMPQPTLEQIRSAHARGAAPDQTALPEGVPTDIVHMAREVTAGAGSDYDAMVALQDWFRGPEFAYSLTAPVDQGFDRSGLEAIDDFLRVKEGYCIHFASAFAVMARVLDMPSRIVIGYLPGVADTTTLTDGDRLTYTVSSSQLHSWPEVYFDGIGWVPFEPTKGLGVPTAFTAQDASQTGADQDPTPTADPTTSPTADDDEDETDADPDAQAQTGTGPSLAAVAGWAGGVAAAVLVLLSPMMIADARRRRRDRAARAGDALAAWMAVRESAIDLGVPVDAAQSPRAVAARLVAEHGAPPEPMQVVVQAVEAAAYAPGAPSGSGATLAEATAQVDAGMRAATTRSHRVRARLMPRSLIVRPGSESARAGASPPTR